MDRSATRFKVADNSGAKEVGLIKVLRNIKVPRVGSVVVVSIKKIHSHSKVRRGEVHKALVVRSVSPTSRKDGSWISFDHNAVVLLSENIKLPFGTRIFGPIPFEIKSMGFDKISSMAEFLV